MGVYKSDSWKKASIYNPLTGDVALMTTLIGGETFLAPQEAIEQEITNGNYVSQWRNRVQFACSDWDAYDTLKSFKEGHIAVQAVASAESLNCANLQWYESVKIKELRKVPKPRRADADSHFVVVLEHEGDENAAIFNNVNLLYQTNVNGVVLNGFVDLDEDNLPDGWTSTNLTNRSFNDGVFAAENSAVSSYFISKVIMFPLPFIKLIVSQNVLQKYDNNNGFRIEQKNIINTDIDVDIIEKNQLGVVSYPFTLLENVFNINLKLCHGSFPSATGFTGSIKEPCLRTDGSSEYIAG